MEKNQIRKYRKRTTGEVVTAMHYESVNDFELLKAFVADVFPSITPAHTRIYEGTWVIRGNDDCVTFMQCSTAANCFEHSYELFK